MEEEQEDHQQLQETVVIFPEQAVILLHLDQWVLLEVALQAAVLEAPEELHLDYMMVEVVEELVVLIHLLLPRREEVVMEVLEEAEAALGYWDKEPMELLEQDLQIIK